MPESDRMAEAEVTLRLAEYMLTLQGPNGRVKVSIDGAARRINGRSVFPIETYLKNRRWKREHTTGKNRWAGTYQRDSQVLEITCRPGCGDLDAKVGKRRGVAECKKGPLVRAKGGKEHFNLTHAIGQALISKIECDDDIVLVAVPYTEQFKRLACNYQKQPLVKRAGIRICLVPHGTGDIFWPGGSPFRKRG